MKFLSLFAGIGGFDRGLELAGHECIGQVEIDPFCRRVLARHWPHVARWPDVRKWKSNGDESAFCVKPTPGSQANGCSSQPERTWRTDTGAISVDLLCGGFPCQDLSVAGKRAGLSGARSGLFSEIVRIAKETKPTWGLFENVPGLLSSNGGRDMWTVLNWLRECWPIVVYRILNSQHFGVPQRRRRVFFVCGPSEQSVREILFESESSSRNFTQSRETGERITTLVSSGPPGTRREDESGLVLTHALTGEGFDASEDGTGRGTPIVAAPITASYGKQIDSSDRNGGPPNLIHGVRRLTPVECERLQGFPDNWTCLCEGECHCSDSPRYRALGNAVTVNVIEWLGNRLRNDKTSHSSLEEEV